MKCLGDIKRHYYKYTYSTWTQPVLTSDGILGGDSFAVYVSSYQGGYEAYKGFDNNTSTYFSTYSKGIPPLIMFNPNPLNVTSIEITWRGSDALVASIYASNDNSEWVFLTSFTKAGSYVTQNIDLSSFVSNNYYRYYKIEPTSGNFWDFLEAKLNATQRNIIESTEDDYDYYEDTIEYKVHASTERKYYKYGNEISIPQYSSQEEAEAGKDGIKIISGSYLWKIFGNTTDETKYSWNREGNRVAIIDFGAPCEFLTYNFKGQGAYQRAYDVKLYPVEGSDDGISWDVIDSTNRTPSYDGPFPSGTKYRYLRVTFHHYYSDGGHSSVGCWLQYFNATVKPIVEATEDDYDYYVDEARCYAVDL